MSLREYIVYAVLLALNLVFVYKNIFLKSILCFILNYFAIKYLHTTWHIDLLTRVSMEDFFVLNFYFFWTSAHHLLTFVFIGLTLFYFFLFYFYSLSFYAMLYFFISILFIFLLTNPLYSFNPQLLITENYKVNPLLTNKVNKVHPLLFYSSFFIFFLKPLPVFFRKFQLNGVGLAFSHWSVRTAVILSSSLYLGSWWALQEGSWGGWWNWDPSEVFGLYAFYIIIRAYHNQMVVSQFQSFFAFFSSYFFCLLLYYFLMQLNFTLISHNFGFRKKYFIFEKFFLGTLVYFIVGMCTRDFINRYFFYKYFCVRKYTALFTPSLYLVFSLFILLAAPLALLNYNFYLGSLTSVAMSYICFSMLLLYILILLINPSTLGIGFLFTFWSYLALLYIFFIKSLPRLTHGYGHILIFFLTFCIYFFVNKFHGWTTHVFLLYADTEISYLSLHTLFFNEVSSIELFSKSHSYKTFHLSFFNKTLHQALLLSEEAGAPPLVTLDYTLPYFSLSALYLGVTVVMFIWTPLYL